MNNVDLSLLLVLLGGTSAAMGWVGRKAGDAPRDVLLLLAIGGCLLAAGLGLYFGPWR